MTGKDNMAHAVDADDDSRPTLVVSNLRQRLTDRGSGESFEVDFDRTLHLAGGTFAALLGPSGCGKTTLLTVLGLLRKPTAPSSVGRFEIYERDVQGRETMHDVRALWMRGAEARVESLRRRLLGFALQSGELLPFLTAWENVAIPLRLNGWREEAIRRRVAELLFAFRLLDSPDEPVDSSRIGQKRVNKLSGGEYQRIALARAIAHRPRIAFIDEPTSALNRELAREALAQLRESQLRGVDPGAAIMITHDEALVAEFADLVVRLEPTPGERSGRVVEIVRQHPRIADAENVSQVEGAIA